MNRPAEAKAGLTASLAQRPDFVWTYLLRGFAHGQLRAFDCAEADFQKALRLNPNAETAYALHLNRGVLRLEQGALSEAAADFSCAAALRPDQYRVHVNLALLSCKEDQLEAALRHLDQPIRLRPPASVLAGLHAERGHFLYLAGNYPEALKASEQALKSYSRTR